jgi:drug/metabolite transporter (DMT)-like permease
MTMSMLLGVLTAILSSAALNVGVVLQALDARQAPPEEALRLSLLSNLARHRRWLAGFGLIGIGFGLQVLALSLAPFVVVQPVLASGLLLVLVLGVRILDERIGAAEVLGVLGIVGGIALLTIGTPSGTEKVASPTAAIVVTTVLGGVAFLPLALRGRGRFDSATFVMVASGLAFGAGNITTKMISDSIGASDALVAGLWLLAALITAVIALITEMTALQRRPATIVVPLIFSVQTFLPVVLEPIYLQDRWGSAALDGAPLIVGLLMVLLGSVAVARTRAVSALVAAP